MIGALAMALLAPQDASGSLGKFRWPPDATAETATYRIELVKTRALDDATRRAERDARQDAGLYAPARLPKQEIAMTVTAELTPHDDLIAGRYTIEVGRSSLRWELTNADAVPGATVACDRLWGPPDEARAEVPVVPRALVEGAFEHATPRAAPRVRPADAPDPYLLPVFWEGALPVWVEHVVALVELADVHVVPGKSVIRDAIAGDQLGQRTSRVEVKFVRGSSSSFEFEYELAIVQRVDRSRVGGARLAEPYEWRIDVAGEATFSLEHGRFQRVDEKITGRLVDPPVDRLVDLRDDVFSGRIRLELVPKAAVPRRRG